MKGTKTNVALVFLPARTRTAASREHRDQDEEKVTHASPWRGGCAKNAAHPPQPQMPSPNCMAAVRRPVMRIVIAVLTPPKLSLGYRFAHTADHSAVSAAFARSQKIPYIRNMSNMSNKLQDKGERRFVDYMARDWYRGECRPSPPGLRIPAALPALSA